MSDDKQEDPWTQGPERPRTGANYDNPQGPQTIAMGEDAEILRERQRLAQVDVLDRWIGGILVEQRRTRRWKLFFRFLFAALILTSIGLSVYGIFGSPGGSAPAGPHLGIVKVQGIIDIESRASADRVIQGLNRAWESDDASAVVLHINSPGGSPVQSQRIFEEIMRLREKGDKPIIAVIEDIGASGAYYIAAAADEVVAAPASLVGSIGVVSAGFGFQEAIDNLGVERRVYSAGDNKAFLDAFSAVSPEQRDFWQSVLETTHEQFIADVREGRGDRLSGDDRLFSGLIWNGEQALELGLVDTIGNLDVLARERLPEPMTRDYTPGLDPFERLSRRLGIIASEWLGLPSSVSPLRYQLY